MPSLLQTPWISQGWSPALIYLMKWCLCFILNYLSSPYLPNLFLILHTLPNITMPRADSDGILTR